MNIGFEIEFSLSSFNSDMIFLLREASFIQPTFPPTLELSEILNFEAEFSNPFLDIEFLISLYFC